MKTPLLIAFVVFAPILLGEAVANAADVVWIGGTGAWNASGNWSPAQVPGPGDNAFLTNSGTYTVTVPAGTSATVGSVAVGGGSGAQTLSIDRATLTLNGASVVNPNGQMELAVSQSVLTGAGDLTILGTLSWSNGTMSGSGITTIAGGGILSVGSGGVTLARSMMNGGSVSWSGGNLSLDAGASLNNLSGGTFDITADGHLSGSAATPLSNSGLFRQVTGNAGTLLSAPFNNNGTLQVLASSLSLNLGGTHNGTFNTSAGATLNFGGGAHVLTASSLVTGAGVMNVAGAATLNASGVFDAGSTLNVTAGVATLASTCNVTGATLNILGNGGILLFNSAGSVSAVALTAGLLGGTGSVAVSGPLTLSGGTVTNALVTANGGLTIAGNTTLSGTKLVNPGTAVWSAGSFTGANGAVFSNLVAATFINTFDGNAASGAGTTPTFVNEGLFQKTGGTAALGTTSIDYQFINSGTVEVQTNTLRYGVNQQVAGLTLLDGGGLAAQAQPIQLLGGSLVGTGLVTVANVQNVINSAAISPGLPLGQLDISGNYQQVASGVLKVDLGGYSPGTTYDLVTVAAGGAGGVATLGGTLNVTLTNGFSPTNGATFTFLTAASRVGAFAAFNYPSNDLGMQLIYDATSAAVKVTNLKPVVTNPIADPASVTYGAAFSFQFPANTFSDPDNDPLSYSSSGAPPGITFNGSTRTFSGTPTQAGIFVVEVVATDGGSPSLTATNSFTATISPASLTIAAQLTTKTYGAPDPALAYTVSGFKFTDTQASVLTGGLTRAQGESVAASPYAISQGTLSANGNYTINFTGSTLTITPAILSVSADKKTKTYGSADPAFTVGYAGFLNGDTAAVLGGNLTFTRAPGENVGSYPITPSGLTSDNYAITFNPGNLSITKASLAIAADAKAKTYGAADPVFTVSYSGFVNGETAVVLGGTLAFSRVSGEAVGDYLITPSGLTSANYAITFNTGALSVTKASLAIAADAKAKTYGAADPVFTVSYSGFVNGETAVVLGGTLALSRVPGEAVGDYLITPSGLTSANYAMTFNTGTLSIAKAGLSITADAKTKTYSSADPVFKVSYSGFVNGETAVVLGGTLAFSRVAGEAVGDYLITPSGLTSANYAMTFNTGTLSIAKASLSITADTKSKLFGSADPVFTVTYAGFVNGEGPGVLSGALTISRASGENVGTYTITPGGLTSANYALTLNSGTLTIIAAPAAVNLALTNAGTSNVLLSWNAISNITYRVQYKSTLNESNWADLPVDVTAAAITATKTDNKTATNRFYRIKLLP